MASHQCDGAFFVRLADALDVVCIGGHDIQKPKGVATSTTRAGEEQYVGFDDDRVGGHKMPTFAVGAREQRAGMRVNLIVRGKEPKESTAIDKNTLHLRSFVSA